ncbi:hypothetical protein [Sphingomonas sp. Marseille-Q8236]
MMATTVPYQASPRTLARASLAALTGGAAILVLFVLPAEYGLDPTGVGHAIGLTALTAPVEEEEAPAAPFPKGAAPVAVAPQTQASIDKTTPWRSDERTVTIAPHQGVELKAEMKAGDALQFRWTATGPVKMDMHGETSMTADSFTTYWKQRGMRSAQGSFTAPFSGIHGWYWRNQGETPVTLTLKTDGFYAKLFQPKS